MKGLFDEMGVLHIVEPSVEEADLGNYGRARNERVMNGSMF